MVFEKAANGTVTLESAGWEGGRLLPGTGADKVLYVVKDHLGSVRVVKDGTGAVRQRFDYYPYGTVSRTWASNTTTDNSEKRYRFGGKEITGSALTDLAGGGAAPGAPYLDFGARLYSPRTAAWLSQDPMAEKYYSINPYTYCTGNPIYLVDPKGMEIWIYLNRGQKNEQALRYEAGALFYANGDLYDGDDPFARSVLTSLYIIDSIKDDEISYVMSTFISSPRRHIIEKDQGNDDATGVVEKTYGKSLAHSGIPVAADIHVSLKKRTIDDDLPNTPTITLGHEIMHAFDYDQGNYKGMIDRPKSAYVVDSMEIRAVYFENIIRKNRGLPIRKTYGSNKISNSSLNSIKIRKHE